MTDAGMALIRKQKKRQRDKLRRLARGAKTRADYLASHEISKEKPWLKLGIKRSTWYSKHRWTGPRQVNLTKTELAPVQKEKHGSNAGECVRVSTATPAGLVQTCVSAQADWLTTYVPVEPVTLVALINEADWSANTNRLAA
jgi:hypothetical protein